MNIRRGCGWLVVLVLCSILGQAGAQVPEGEREALIRLYDATGGDQWKHRMRWGGAEGSECEWYGIVCNPGDGDVRHVTQLLLNDNQLTGALPASLAELEHLTTLRLSSNALEGSLPESLWHLNQLRVLSLDDNNMSGSLPGTLLYHPIHSLQLSGNRFSGFGTTGATPHWPAEPRALMLADNLFEELPPVAWRQHGRIRSLDLSGNHLGPVLDLGQAPWPELETLQLSGNDIAQVLGMASDLLPELRTLDLSDNRIEPWPLDDAPFERLEQLNLAGNELNELPSALLELEDLEILDLGDNRLDGELPDWFGDLSLRELGLGNNNLEGPIERVISALDTDNIVVPDDESQMPFAQTRLRLHVQDNRFSGSLPDELDYRKFNSPHGISFSPEFGLDLCFNDIDRPSDELLESINPVHRGLDLTGCLGRERSSLGLTQSGTWFDPERSGEGLTQMLLTDGQVLSFWFTYYPQQSFSTDPQGQMWLFGMTEPQGKYMEHRDLLIPAGGSFGQGFPAQGPEHQWWEARTRQDRVDDDNLHLAYELHHGGLCITGGCYFAVKTGRRDMVPLTRLAGTTCDNRQPNEWISGAWYNPDANGEGFVVEVIEDGRGVVYWFTHQPDDSGRQAWMTGDGHFDGQTLIIDNLLQPVGTRFGGDFATEEIDFAHWGRLEIEFDDDLNGHVSFHSVHENYGSGYYPIERLARPMLAECE